MHLHTSVADDLPHHYACPTVNGRPVFKVLIPDIFMSECGWNSTLAAARIGELRAAGLAAGVGSPVVGGGWQNPAIPAGSGPHTPLPHPSGYMVYNHTDVVCPRVRPAAT